MVFWKNMIINPSHIVFITHQVRKTKARIKEGSEVRVVFSLTRGGGNPDVVYCSIEDFQNLKNKLSVYVKATSFADLARTSDLIKTNEHA